MSETNDDQSLLASAYLDGEATVDERALVETDPDAMAEVESLGRVRTVLGATVEPVSLSSREAHLAAALDVFERMSDSERLGEATPADGVDAAAAAAVSTPPSSSDTGRHRRPQRKPAQWLLGAAAAGLLLIGGAVVVRSITSGDDDSDFSAAEVPAATDGGDATSEIEIVESAEADAVLGEEGEPLPAETDLSDDTYSADELGADDGLFAEEATDGDEATSADVAEDSAGGETADTAPSDAEEVAPPAEIDLVALETPEDLADFATLAVRSANSGAPAPTADVDFDLPPGSCEEQFSAQERAGFASYQGTVVQVGVDLVNRIAYAYTDECVEIARVALTPEQVAEG